MEMQQRMSWCLGDIEKLHGPVSCPPQVSPDHPLVPGAPGHELEQRLMPGLDTLAVPAPVGAMPGVAAPVPPGVIPGTVPQAPPVRFQPGAPPPAAPQFPPLPARAPGSTVVAPAGDCPPAPQLPPPQAGTPAPAVPHPPAGPAVLPPVPAAQGKSEIRNPKSEPSHAAVGYRNSELPRAAAPSTASVQGKESQAWPRPSRRD
jgi:hypothetical protein